MPCGSMLLPLHMHQGGNAVYTLQMSQNVFRQSQISISRLYNIIIDGPEQGFDSGLPYAIDEF